MTCQERLDELKKRKEQLEKILFKGKGKYGHDEQDPAGEQYNELLEINGKIKGLQEGRRLTLEERYKNEIFILEEIKDKIVYVENEIPHYIIDERIKVLKKELASLEKNNA